MLELPFSPWQPVHIAALAGTWATAWGVLKVKKVATATEAIEKKVFIQFSRNRHQKGLGAFACTQASA